MASRAHLQQQVRSREMEYERQQAQKLKEQKEKKRQKLLHRLKELWREQQERRITVLAEECARALQCIGQSHATAALFMQKQEAMKMERRKQAELNQLRESSRFKIALQKERVRRKLESNPITLAKRRKRAKDSAAQWERSLGRFSSHKAKFRLLSREISSGVPSRGWFAEQKEDMSLLQPSDYKHTFLHSRLFVSPDDGVIPSKDNEMDAWKAADLQRQLMDSYRIMQMQIRTVMDRRKVLRGQLAGSKLMIEKTLQLLEHENLAIEKAEIETRRITSRKKAADTIQPQGVDKPLLESPKSLKTRSGLPDKASERSPDKEGKHEVPQGVAIISCSNGPTLHISAVKQSDDIVPDSCQEEQTVDHTTTSMLCCKEDTKTRLDSTCDDACSAAKGRACQKKARKLPQRVLAHKSDGIAVRGRTQDCLAKGRACQKKARKLPQRVIPHKLGESADRRRTQDRLAKSKKPSYVIYPWKKKAVLGCIKIDRASSEGKAKDIIGMVHSQSDAKEKLTKRAAGSKPILFAHDDSSLHEHRKQKFELRVLPPPKPVKAVTFK